MKPNAREIYKAEIGHYRKIKVITNPTKGTVLCRHINGFECSIIFKSKKLYSVIRNNGKTNLVYLYYETLAQARKARCEGDYELAWLLLYQNRCARQRLKRVYEEAQLP
jgi:hypothetical protein